MPSTTIIDNLYALIQSRRGGDPETSYTAKLFARGMKKIAQKIGEEAVELALEAVQGNAAKMREESADLLYHLLVLWAEAGLKPDDVFTTLESRLGTSGIDEKNNRPKEPAP